MFGSSKPRYRFYPQERSTGARILGLVRLIVLLFLLYELVSTFLITSYRAESSAMEPGLQAGDRVLVSPLPFGASIPLLGARGPAIGEPRRGDLVVVTPSYGPPIRPIMQPLRSLTRFFTGGRAGGDDADWRPEVTLRRIIALPGDTVRMEDFIFYVRTPDGEGFRSEFEASGVRYALEREGMPESWSGELPFGTTMEPVELGETEYFLAADNRLSGLDSRHRGPVSAEALRSRVVLRYWPASRFGRP